MHFAQSGYMKPGINFWKSLTFESKQKFRGFVNAARAKIGEGTPEEQVAAFASLVPNAVQSKGSLANLDSPVKLTPFCERTQLCSVAARAACCRIESQRSQT
jgi:hypothetical protein